MYWINKGSRPGETWIYFSSAEDKIAVIEIKKILAPTDLSILSIPAIRYALDVGLERNAEVIVYHVIATDYGFGEDDPLNPASALMPQQQERLEAFMEENFAGQVKSVKITQQVECGDPYQKIVAKAERERADLIVMSTHGRTGLEHLIVGSVTAKVVARAGCPVLSIKPK